MNVVATGSGRFIEVQGTAEDGTFTPEQLGAMTGLALRGITQLTEYQQRAIDAAAS